jgi:hypothetical protein
LTPGAVSGDVLTTSTVRSRIAAAAAWFVLVLFLFPGFASTLGVGLDPSWAYAINALSETDRLPGRDVVFTYGPFGWLFRPAAVGDHLMWVVVFRLLTHALFATALARAIRGAPIAHVLAFAGIYLASHQLGLAEEYRLLLSLVLLLGPELAAPRRIPWAPALAAALIPFYALMKLNFGLTAGVIVAAFCGVLILRRKPGRGRTVLAAAAGFSTATLIAVPLAFGSPSHALRWLGLQAEIVRGYPAAMALPATPAELVAGFLALAVFVGFWIHAYRTGSGLADLWVLLLLPAWFAFQHGFIRADAHVGGFFPFVLAAAALGVLFARRESELRASVAVCLALLLIATPIALRYAGPASRTRVNFVLGIQGWQNLRHAMRPDTLQRRVERFQRRVLRPHRLPTHFAKPVRAAGLGVDVLPWELSYLAANRLRWVPNPTLQLYVAYTPRLDALSARHFASAKAADLLLVEHTGIDRRDMLWDTPETWRAILASYQLDPRRPAPNLLVLRRRSRPSLWGLKSRGEVRGNAGRWIEVPGGSGWTFARIHLQPSWTGRAERFLLGVPPVLLETVDDQGRRRTARVLPETAIGGLMMTPAPRNLDELAALWSGAPPGKIVRFRFTGPGLRCFKREVRVRWLAGTLGSGP